jgi:hypothetical protein
VESTSTPKASQSLVRPPNLSAGGPGGDGSEASADAGAAAAAAAAAGERREGAGRGRGTWARGRARLAAGAATAGSCCGGNESATRAGGSLTDHGSKPTRLVRPMLVRKGYRLRTSANPRALLLLLLSPSHRCRSSPVATLTTKLRSVPLQSASLPNPAAAGAGAGPAGIGVSPFSSSTTAVTHPSPARTAQLGPAGAAPTPEEKRVCVCGRRPAAQPPVAAAVQQQLLLCAIARTPVCAL